MTIYILCGYTWLSWTIFPSPHGRYVIFFRIWDWNVTYYYQLCWKESMNQFLHVRWYNPFPYWIYYKLVAPTSLTVLLHYCNTTEIQWTSQVLHYDISPVVIKWITDFLARANDKFTSFNFVMCFPFHHEWIMQELTIIKIL